MPRPKRLQIPHAYYHIINRAASDFPVFQGEEDHQYFLNLTKQLNRRFGVKLIAYSLIPETIHLVVKTERANLSAAIRQLNAVYTAYINQKYGRNTPLFRDRYKSTLFEANAYLTDIVSYIHQRPLVKKHTSSLFEYPYSSYYHYLGNESAYILEDEGIPKGSLQREITESPLPPEIFEHYQKTYIAPILGSDAFKASITKQTAKKERRLTIQTITKATAQHFGCDTQSLTTSCKGDLHTARSVAMYLSQDLGEASLNSIAAHFNMGNKLSPASTIRRLKSKLANDDGLKKKLEKLEKDLQKQAS